MIHTELYFLKGNHDPTYQKTPRLCLAECQKPISKIMHYKQKVTTAIPKFDEMQI